MELCDHGEDKQDLGFTVKFDEPVQRVTQVHKYRNK